MRVDVTAATARTELLVQLAQAGARVQRELSREAILQRACDTLSGLGLRCSMAYPVEGGVRVHAVHLGSELDQIEAVIGSPIVGPVRPMTPLVERVWNEGHAFTGRWPEEVALFMGAPLAPLLQDLGEGGFTRCIGVRVTESGAPGMMMFATGAWLRAEDTGAFRLFADQVGAALDAARTVAQLRERNTELAALNRLAALATAAGELGPMLDGAIAVIEEAAGARAVGVVVLPTHPGGRISHVASDDPTLAAMLRDAPVDEAVFRAVLREGKLRISHGEGVPEQVARAWSDAGFRTVLLVPLRFRGDPVGAVAVTFGDVRPAEACHTDLLGAMSGQLAAAIESHNLTESLRGRISELTLLNDIAAATVALDPSSLLDNVIRGVSATFGADTATAYVDRGGERQVTVPFGVVAALATAPPVCSEDLSQTAITLKRAVRWPGDVPDTPRNRWFREREGVQSAVAVPLLSTDRTVGCFILGRRSSTPFTDDDLRLMTAVGVQLGVAVENARLYEDLRGSYAALARAQEQLIEQERFAALGQLSAVIAHEVRNPVGVIFNSLGTLRRITTPAGDARMLLDIIGEEADRLNRIVGDLLDFARPATPALRPEPLAPLLQDAAKAAGLGASIRFELHVAPDLPPIPMDARMVRQALVNLLTNAAQAMPRGGTLSVDARLEGDQVRLEVADTGGGIPRELLPRLFEPFFTTRPTGTGLGLAIVKRILDEHGATISVEARDPTGTRFIVHLPLTSGDVAGAGR